MTRDWSRVLETRDAVVAVLTSGLPYAVVALLAGVALVGHWGVVQVLTALYEGQPLSMAFSDYPLGRAWSVHAAMATAFGLYCVAAWAVWAWPHRIDTRNPVEQPRGGEDA